MRNRQTRAKDLLIIILAVAAVYLSLSAASQLSTTQAKTSRQGSQTGALAPLGTQDMETQLAPDSSSWPYGRLAALLSFGLLTSYSKLANKFRHFWYLGVTTNGYAVLYFITGATLCYLFHIAGNEVGGTPVIQTAGSWIGDTLGIVAVLVGPSIWPRSRAHLEAENQVTDLQVQFSRNPFFAVLEEKILDCIANRMQKEVVAASERYSWKTIKRAAHATLGEGRAMRQFSDEVFKNETKFVNSLPSTATPGTDHEGKYDALYRILRQCKYRRLIHFLKVATKEGRQ